MIELGDQSWNIRDRHMMETLNRLMNLHGPDSKAIIWEHNTHIGDARFTDMKNQGMVNIGQLAREEHSEADVVLIGFSSYAGTVIAGSSWGAEMQKKQMPVARENSFEAFMHKQDTEDRMLIFNRKRSNGIYDGTFAHRAIGVVYNPAHERFGNYVPTVMSRRYDVMIYLDTTNALHPLKMQPDLHKVPDTYPFSF
jgi:erythromycin esterase